METAILALVTTLGPVLGYVLKKLIDRWAGADAIALENAKKGEKLAGFKEECLKAVRAVDIEYVLPLKKEGKFDSTAAVSAKEKSITILKNKFGPDGLLDLAMFFNTDAEGLDSLINSSIEAALHNNKKIGSISLKDEPLVLDNIKLK